jgi:hypothetical protein
MNSLVVPLMFVVAAGCASLASYPQPDKTALPKPLPVNIVTAWTDAEAKVGWIRQVLASSRGFRLAKIGNPGDVPGFGFSGQRDLGRRLTKLPAPESAFGLHLYNTAFTDTEMKELPRLTQSAWNELPAYGATC